MLNTLLHTGSEHPDLLWIVLPSLLSFVAGLSAGALSDRVRSWLRPRREASND
ncbi:hypothetical protein [Natronococcus jeotgali]|uniref:Uncharacterized protein n=1 Tax=Natronococcus jeotgali DSM 18795 TaxID=1227498 RepID=L9XYH0_9EURY|nr:hypothetical protein [Natronococcus jeotgali]ELY66512.1 hypothetical protein C492_01269 [Natronococcus jeotgali DSM 18795]